MCHFFANQHPDSYVYETRSIRLNGQSTSIRLEKMFWRILVQIAQQQNMSVPRFASEAVGAIRTRPTRRYPSTHNLGANRMSAGPSDGVVNKFGQTHDIQNLFVSDGSQFTTGGAENPTLTIVALAIRQAEFVAGQMSSRAI